MSVAVVIGAGPGIGQAVARRFGKGNHAVALLARRADEVERMAQGLRDEGIKAIGVACDAERAASITDAIHKVVHDLGPVDVLIYNAAVVKPSRPLEIGAEQLVRELRVDVVGLLVAAQAVVPAMMHAGHGTVLVTGGGLALEPWPQMSSLGVGKAAVRSLALSMHKDLAPHGIHAATVTVAGLVGTGEGKLDPAKIAEVFWELHVQEPGKFEGERVIR